MEISPLFGVDTSCCTQFTLSGLTGTRSKTDDTFALTSSSGFEANGAWSLSDSTLIVTLSGNLNAGEPYGFTFDVLNQETELVPSAFPQLSGCGIPTFSFDTGITVSRLTLSAVAGQENPYPCSLNSITVTMALNVALLNTWCFSFEFFFSDELCFSFVSLEKIIHSFSWYVIHMLLPQA